MEATARRAAMKTIPISPEKMAERVARYERLKPLAIQTDPEIPQEALDLIYSRRLLPVIGLESNAATPVSEGAPIRGAAGMTITLAVCPPGQGPGLHAHRRTYETFTVLQGQFEFSHGDDGQHRVILDRFDTISIPPGICRAFRNTGVEEGILQVIITGGVHDMNDIDLVPGIEEQLRTLSPRLLQRVQQQGMSFTAGRGE
jgi:quercetin dioxygenase-like cupin family protein